MFDEQIPTSFATCRNNPQIQVVEPPFFESIKRSILAQVVESNF